MIIKNLSFKSYNQPCQALAVDRAGQPDPESVDRTGRPTCTRSCTRTSHLGWSTERSTDCKYPTLGWGRSTGRLGTIDRAVDRPESKSSLELAWSTGRLTDRLNGHLFDRWPIDRPVNQKAILGLVSCQRLVFYGAYINPI